MVIKSGIWFFILAILSVLLNVLAFWRKKDLKLVALQLFLSGIAGLVEDVIFIWLQSYEYFPGLLKIRYYDNALGAYFSQVLYVSSVAVVIAAFKLDYGWVLAFAIMFVGIEFLFLGLGIYKLNWWRPGYTFLGLLFFFWLAKKWYTLLLQASSPAVRFISLICSNYILYGNLIVIPALGNHYLFTAGWFSDSARNTLVFVVMICFIRGLITALICFYKLPWAIMAAVPVLLFISYFVLVQLGLLVVKHLLDFWLLPVTDIIVLFCSNNLNRVLVGSYSMDL